MPVLLLCQGDPAAKDLLRKAIEARYGINPPAFEKLQIAFKGRARVDLALVKTWVPVDALASFIMPTHLRWDFVVKPLKLPVRRGVEAFDGQTYRSGRGSNTNEKTQTDMLTSARGRLWAVAALLLTPLSEYTIKLSICGDRCIEAENTKLEDSVKIHLREDYTIERVEVNCWNPDKERTQLHTFQTSQQQIPVNDLMLPEKMVAYWDDEIAYEMEPLSVQHSPNFDERVFRLERDVAMP